MVDCFGIDISLEEMAYWNRLTAGPEGFAGWETLIPYRLEAKQPVDGEAFMRKWLPLAPAQQNGEAVVEFGCGIGGNVPPLLQIFARYIGIDVSRFCVAMARYLFEGGKWAATFLHSTDDGEGIARLRNVGAVVGVNFFYHQCEERLGAMIKTAYHMLRPGGWMHIDMAPNAGLPRRDEARDRLAARGDKWPGYYVPAEAICLMAQKVGFTRWETMRTVVEVSERENPRREFTVLWK